MTAILLFGLQFPCTGVKLQSMDEKTNTDSAVDISSDSAAESDSANDNTIEVAENIIQNPSFEEGDVYWNIWGGAVLVEENAQDGN